MRSSRSFQNLDTGNEIMNLSQPFRSEVVTVYPTDTIRRAAQLMRTENVGAVVVVNKGDDRVVGILTDRDIALNLGMDEVNADSVVERAMTSPAITIRESGGILNATEYFKAHGIRRLPIVNDASQLVGMLTVDDVLSLLGDELKNLSRALSPALCEPDKYLQCS
jgi:CBS domain-containing protein